MQFGLPSPIIRLYEESSAFAIRDYASEASLKAGSATRDHDGADIPARLQALVFITLGRFYLFWMEMQVIHGPIHLLEHTALPVRHICLLLNQKGRQSIKVENEIHFHGHWILYNRVHPSDFPGLLQEHDILGQRLVFDLFPESLQFFLVLSRLVLQRPLDMSNHDVDSHTIV